MSKLDEAFLWFMVGIGASSAGVAGVALIKLGASQEAFFSLFGAFFGASATIVGAAWLADRTTRFLKIQ